MSGFLTNMFSKLFGSKSDKDLKLLLPYVDKINQAFEGLKPLSDDELRQKTQEVKGVIDAHLQNIDEELKALHQRIADEPNLDIDQKEEIFKEIDALEEQRNEELEKVLMEVLPDAFAIVKETARRLKDNGKLVVTATDRDRQRATEKDFVTIEGDKAIWGNEWTAASNTIKWDMVHYDVQLVGGIVLHQGKIAEMATGEGKTLVATLPSFLNALAKRGVHIVTVNNYLAKRDAEWMAPLMEFHGLVVDCIDKYEPHSDERKAAYQADITYGTNNEFGFDYLRDNMARSEEDQVQRRHHFAMVDEVDSVLIDDARTPLIISGPIPRGDEQEFEQLKPRVQRLYEAQRRLVQNFLQEAKRLIKEGDTEAGGMALLRAHRGLPKSKPLIKFLSETGMKAILQKTENFYLQENAKHMPEVDKPLLFTIEEKNNSIDLTEKGLDAITRTEQGEEKDFFVLPDISVSLDKVENDEKLSDEEKLKQKDEIINDYNAKTQRIHTVNQLLKAYTLFEKDVDYILVDNKVKIVDEQTGRVMEGRRYSDGLHQALEAKESVKIEDATQTYATITLQNYFRMYHKLAGMTGTAETEAGELWEIYKLDVVVIPTNRPIVRDDREDKVYKTIREKYNAAADEIREMVDAGRPVLVGTTSVENSEILSRLLNIRKIEHQILNAKQHAREADVVAKAGMPGTVTIATNMAGRGTDIKLHPDAKEAGGLAIVGTERHESRRVDRQLRGRSGRQGDPGSSQFFVSLEDNLMRLFGSDRAAKIMDRLGLEDGDVIQHSMITKSIERAQRKVEENNFAMRKRLLEYDDVMNSQREVIYKRRNNALNGERLQLDLMNHFYDVAENIAENTQGDYEGFKLNQYQVFGLDAQVPEEEFEKLTPAELAFKLYTTGYSAYQAKIEQVLTMLNPLLLAIKKSQPNTEYLPIPFNDHRGRQLVIPIQLEKAIETGGKSLSLALEQALTLHVIDQSWKEHLREMDDLKEQVQNARFEQKDPLLIYKFEAFELFKEFIGNVNIETVSLLSKITLAVQEPDELERVKAARKRQQQQRLRESKANVDSALTTNGSSNGGRQQQPQAAREQVEVTKPRKVEKTIGRNDMVTVKYADGKKRTAKYKKVEGDLKDNKCVLIEG